VDGPNAPAYCQHIYDVCKYPHLSNDHKLIISELWLYYSRKLRMSFSSMTVRAMLISRTPDSITVTENPPTRPPESTLALHSHKEILPPPHPTPLDPHPNVLHSQLSVVDPQT